MPRRSTEQENEKYVLRALAAARRNEAGIKEITTRVNEFLAQQAREKNALLAQQGKRKSARARELREDQVRAVLASLEAQGKASKWSEAPAIWGISTSGRKDL